MGAHVEVIEYVEQAAITDLPCIRPSTVLVNGTDVGLVAADGVQIDTQFEPGGSTSGKVTAVTITLLVRSVEIKAVQGSRPGTA